MIFDIIETLEFDIKFITSKYLSIIKKYLNPNFSFYLTNNDFNKLLMHICYLDNITLLNFLLLFKTNKKIKLNVESLNYACENNNLQMVKLLLLNNSSINNDSINYACKHNNLQMVKLLLSYYNIKNDSSLIIACKNSNLKLLKILLQNYTLPKNKLQNYYTKDTHISKFLLEL